jgi:hypothetical protein
MGGYPSLEPCLIPHFDAALQLAEKRLDKAGGDDLRLAKIKK